MVMNQLHLLACLVRKLLELKLYSLLKKCVSRLMSDFYMHACSQLKNYIIMIMQQNNVQMNLHEFEYMYIIKIVIIASIISVYTL